MKNLSFPIFKTKSLPGAPLFDLNDPRERKKYFRFKAGTEIKKIQKYLENNTFLVLLLGKKGSGKGTYSKLFAEAVGGEKLVHLSVGDIVRAADEEVTDANRRRQLIDYLKHNYRGYYSLEAILEAQENRGVSKPLLPSEYILALIKREIEQVGRKAIFLDGFPRNLDQISYSLFFRDLIGFRDDPDFLVLIDIPKSVIDARIKTRVVCPLCQTPRNLKLFTTKRVGYDRKTKSFYLYCDSPGCKGVKMLAKEGDELGIEAIKDRLEADEQLIKRAFSLYGVSKILLRNSIPVNQAKQMVDDYEITPEYFYQRDSKKKMVKTLKKPWIVKDDNGVPSYSLLAPPVTIALIKQLADLLPT
jgi:adenylate kinase family enzyme